MQSPIRLAEANAKSHSGTAGALALEPDATSASTIAALAAGVVALGIRYRRINELDGGGRIIRPGETAERKDTGSP